MKGALQEEVGWERDEEKMPEEAVSKAILRGG